MNLKKQTGKNLGYVSFMQVFIRIVRIISTIILMKILTPYDFGIVAIAMILINIFRNIETLGINAAIIQKDEKNVNNIVLSTGFIIKIFISAFLFSVVFIAAPNWARIYNEPNVIWVMRFIALIFVLSPFVFVPDIKLRKNLNFKKYVVPNIGRVFTYSIFAIIFAYLGLGYKSLIFGTLFGEVTRVLIFNRLSPWRIKFYFNMRIARDLFAFGIWIVLSAILFSIYSVIDNAIIGKIFGAATLGYYVVAYRWAHFASNNIRPIFQTVMFPTFSNIKNKIVKLQKAYLYSLKYISLFVFPITVGWILLADKFILSIIGNKWESAIIPLQILSISGLLRSLQIGGTLFPALGKPRISTSILFAQFVILIGLIYPLTLYYGLVGACLAVVITFSITTSYVFLKISKLIELSVKIQFKEMIVPGISSISMGIVLLFMKNIRIFIPAFFEFFLLFFIGVISYIIFLIIYTRSKIIKEIKEIIYIFIPKKEKHMAKIDLQKVIEKV